MDIQTVCIIGGAGFVGRSIADQACAAGHRVRVVTRSRPRARELTVLPTLEVVVADVNGDAGLERALDGMDAVINLSGVLYPRRGSSFQQVHAELPRRIAYAAMKAGVRRMLHMSSLGAGGNAPSEYLRSKGDGEVAVRSGPSEVERTVFRPSVIFGEHDDFLNMFATMARISPVVPLARAQTRFQPIWVEDVARCFVTSPRGSAHLRPGVRPVRPARVHARRVDALRDRHARHQAQDRWRCPIPSRRCRRSRSSTCRAG
jgi:NADH dehydrogenase